MPSEPSNLMCVASKNGATAKRKRLLSLVQGGNSVTNKFSLTGQEHNVAHAHASGSVSQQPNSTTLTAAAQPTITQSELPNIDILTNVHEFENTGDDFDVKEPIKFKTKKPAIKYEP